MLYLVLFLISLVIFWDSASANNFLPDFRTTCVSQLHVTFMKYPTQLTYLENSLFWLLGLKSSVPDWVVHDFASVVWGAHYGSLGRGQPWPQEPGSKSKTWRGWRSTMPFKYTPQWPRGLPWAPHSLRFCHLPIASPWVQAVSTRSSGDSHPIHRMTYFVDWHIFPKCCVIKQHVQAVHIGIQSFQIEKILTNTRVIMLVNA